jgi:hypothetical protein
LIENKNRWSDGHFHEAAIAVTALGFLARLWTASSTFLNPDEALHFRLANQTSLALAYKESLTAAHPPLLILLLYFWRAFGTSELWLRLPSVIAGAAFCWMFYKWLSGATGRLTGFIGLLFVAFLPPIILIAAEIRQYSPLLAFLAAALYFLDEAIAHNSVARMAAFALCLYFAMLFHYSAFLFAAALGIYALLRILAERPSASVIAVWTIGQCLALGIALFLYKTHLSRLGAGDSKTAMQGWMSEFYLHRSYFDPAHDNPVAFVVGHSFGVFQYFFGQLAVGDAMGLLFVVGVVLLIRGKVWPLRTPARALVVFLILPFAIASAASLAHVYPNGGTRHVAFLIIPGVAGVSVAVARLANDNWKCALAATTLILVACLAFGKPRPPRIERADQSRAHMAAAMEFVSQNINSSDIIFTDYQSDLILGHYLCQQRPISIEAAPAGFEQFSCAGYHVISADFKTAWQFFADDFPKHWQELMQTYNLKSGDTVWVFQAGWGVDLAKPLKNQYAELRDLQYESFGKNIEVFKLAVGQPMPVPLKHDPQQSGE